MALSEPDRYKVDNKERQTHLMVHNLTESDSGLYYCSAVYPIGSSMGHVELKVSSIVLSQICSRFLLFSPDILVFLLLEGHLLLRASQALRRHRGGGGDPGRRHLALREEPLQEETHRR